MKKFYDPDYIYLTDKRNPDQVTIITRATGERCVVSREIATEMQTMAKRYFRLTYPQKVPYEERARQHAKKKAKKKTQKNQSKGDDDANDNHDGPSSVSSSDEIHMETRNSIKRPLSYDTVLVNPDSEGHRWLINPNSMEEEVEMQIVIESFLQTLTPWQRTIFTDIMLWGDNQDEWAEKNGVSQSTVATHVGRLRRKFKKFYLGCR